MMKSTLSHLLRIYYQKMNMMNLIFQSDPDSNDEDFYGNDYPDEDDWGHDTDDSDEDYYVDRVHRHVGPFVYLL